MTQPHPLIRAKDLLTSTALEAPALLEPTFICVVLPVLSNTAGLLTCTFGNIKHCQLMLFIGMCVCCECARTHTHAHTHSTQCRINRLMGLAQGKSCGPLQPCLVLMQAGGGGGGGGGGGAGGGGGSSCSRAGVFGGPRQKGSWRPLHPRSRVHFPGLNITPSDIIRFPPCVAGLFRTQRTHVFNHF